MSHDKEGFYCKRCGKFHDELPMSYGSPIPDYVYDIPMEEQESRIEMNDDLCIIDEEYYFIRGCIELPVIDGEGPFTWDVWVSLSKANFNKTIENWDIQGREEELQPMFGWLSTSIPCYPETINLKTMVHTRPVGVTPYIELEPIEHPLALEQRNGITIERIKQLAEGLCDQDDPD
ncbi:hypothetical protein A8F94_15110 [Bacillus sp. FJAT-27225]|uniref:DUF2199 domain-containing protein n=1 Tax=Bacillus sp. FJAT-27225 TaxID=1743144 RepID=UPI00080C2729|nr:DUF2199 domain-containing protein [Bacillus sp. FJAT-27225]OCA84057.1 hypothetical protein A8F94_15110 [Bacillus sp. FJAT-27225]